jgi:hypothetical protein
MNMGWTVNNAPAGIGAPTEGLWTPTVDQQHRIGERYQDGLGRVYRYVKNGGTALGAGLMTSGELIDTDSDAVTQTAYGVVAIGDTRVTVLLVTANALVDGELQDGQLLVSSSTGMSYSYAIANNTWITGDTVMSIELYEPIRVAWSATTVITVAKNRYRDVNVTATTQTALTAGVPTCVIPASYYGWVQRRGPCAMVVDTGETLVIGCLVGQPAACAVAGAVGVAAIAGIIWGDCIWVAAAAAAALIDLKLE